VAQTEGQVERLERALELMGAKPGRKVCEGSRLLHLRRATAVLAILEAT
jgi:ferritin-like metal-binding protein YciE